MEGNNISSTTAGNAPISPKERTPYISKSHTVCVFEVLQSLRKDEVLCDIILETDDGLIVLGHKVILASASQYFYEMFTNFGESNKYFLTINDVDSTALKLIVDFIYTAKIMITVENVEVLLSAADLLQLNEVKIACCDFLQSELHPKNCLGIKKIADLHHCRKLLLSSESYIQKHFTEVVVSDEFLSLSCENVVEIISSDELTVPSEEEVFESVICWVNHKPGSRKHLLPKLIEHVRLPLTSKTFLINRVEKEPLIKNSFECTSYIIEALNFHLLKSEENGNIPKNIRTRTRQHVGSEVVYVIGGNRSPYCVWYDPVINCCQVEPKVSVPRQFARYVVLKDLLVFSIGGVHNKTREPVCSVNMLDLSSSSPCWVPTVNMLEKRIKFVCAVLDNCIYAVGGHNGRRFLNSAEVFDSSTKQWRMISYMSSKREDFEIGVLDNCVYAIGGKDGINVLKSVECYDPKTDKWIPVADMCEQRYCAGIGVLDGVLYAVGGNGVVVIHRSVEAYRPCTGVWTSIADMHKRRSGAVVVAMNGFLYVMGGHDEESSYHDSLEIYDPDTNNWSLLATPANFCRYIDGVVIIYKHLQFKT